MKVLQGDRRAGKTEVSVKWVKEGRRPSPSVRYERNVAVLSDWHEENTRVLVVLDSRERNRLIRQCGLLPSEVLTFDEVVRYGGLRGREVREVRLDNFDVQIRGLVPGTDVSFTTTEKIEVETL